MLIRFYGSFCQNPVTIGWLTNMINEKKSRKTAAKSALLWGNAPAKCSNVF